MNTKEIIDRQVISADQVDPQIPDSHAIPDSQIPDSQTIQLSKNRSIIIAISPPSMNFPGSAKLTLETFIQMQMKTFTYFIPLGVLGEYIDRLLDIEKLAIDRGYIESDPSTSNLEGRS